MEKRQSNMLTARLHNTRVSEFAKLDYPHFRTPWPNSVTLSSRLLLCLVLFFFHIPPVHLLYLLCFLNFRFLSCLRPPLSQSGATMLRV